MSRSLKTVCCIQAQSVNKIATVSDTSEKEERIKEQAKELNNSPMKGLIDERIDKLKEGGSTYIHAERNKRLLMINRKGVIKEKM